MKIDMDNDSPVTEKEKEMVQFYPFTPTKVQSLTEEEKEPIEKLIAYNNSLMEMLLDLSQYASMTPEQYSEIKNAIEAVESAGAKGLKPLLNSFKQQEHLATAKELFSVAKE